MTRGRGLRTWLPAAATFLVTAAAGACSFDNASSFASEYSAYLETRSEVAEYSVSPNDAILSKGTADTRIRLKDGLTDEEIAAAARDFAQHTVSAAVDEHRIRVVFSVPNGDGRAADANIYVVPGDDNPRLGDVATFHHWATRTREFVASDSGINEMKVYGDQIFTTTANADGLPLAEKLNSFATAEPAGFKYLSVSAPDCNYQWNVGVALSRLAPMQDLLAMLPDGVRPAACRATEQYTATEPSFFVTLPHGTAPGAVNAMRERAARLGLAAEITVGA